VGKIDEHHRQLTALGSSDNPGRCDGRKRCFGYPLRVPQRCNGIEQEAAVPDRRDPEITQIVGRQPPENFTVDVVITERGRVLFEP